MATESPPPEKPWILGGTTAMRTALPRHLTLTLVLACNGKGSDDAPGPTSGVLTSDTGDAPTSGEATESTGGAVVDCSPLCAKWIACEDYRGEDCATYCENSLSIYSYIGIDCAATYLEVVACKVDMTCEELAADPDPCSSLYGPFETDICVNDICRALAARHVECGNTSEDALSWGLYCTIELGQTVLISSACTTAREALYACRSGLTCEQLQQDEGCLDEDAAEDAACGP